MGVRFPPGAPKIRTHMKRIGPEKIRSRGQRGKDVLALEPNQDEFHPELGIRKEDKEKIIADLRRTRPKPENVMQRSWLEDFERCGALFPESKAKLTYSTEDWEEIAKIAEEYRAKYLRQKDSLNYLKTTKFLWRFFPKRKNEFPIDPTLERVVKEKISEIYSKNPIDVDTLSLLYKYAHGALPEVVKSLKVDLASFVRNFPTHLKNERWIDMFTHRLAMVRILFPEVYQTFHLTPDDWEMMKAYLRPLEADDETDWYLGQAYDLLILSAPAVSLSEDGEIIITEERTTPLPPTPGLPERLNA